MTNTDKLVYLDHAATTPTHPEVADAILPFLREQFGNPSSLYSVGREAKGVLEESREKIAGHIGARPEEIYFTSGGTESNNFALHGVAWANRKRGNHIITSMIEHHALLEPCHFLEKQGFEVTYLPVDSQGMVDPGDLRGALTDRTILVSIMHANNEMGTIQPISELAAAARERSICIHTDAVQTMGNVPTDVNELDIDMLSVSAHKLYGPKGVGFLYVRKGTRFGAFHRGGAQERNKRAGTENLAGIVGMAKALELGAKGMAERSHRIALTRDRLVEGLLGKLEGRVRLTGHPSERLPNNVSLCVPGVEGEAMLLLLDMHGICASSGSACTSGSLEPSHVLLAMGIPPEIAHGSLRFTLGWTTSEEDVDRVVEVLPPIVERLRAMSPLHV